MATPHRVEDEEARLVSGQNTDLIAHAKKLKCGSRAKKHRWIGREGLRDVLSRMQEQHRRWEDQDQIEREGLMDSGLVLSKMQEEHRRGDDQIEREGLSDPGLLLSLERKGLLPHPLSGIPRPRQDLTPTYPWDDEDYPECEMIEDIKSINPVWGEENQAAERRLVLKALELYNAMHPGNECELAPGQLVRSCKTVDNCCWTHGNFVARKKRSGCCSFLPAPRALFFFEHINRADFKGVVTCIRLDEPVTEASCFLGFSLGWGSRRLGGSDCVCKTCYRRFDVLYRCMMKICPCGQKVEAVCEMCYGCNDVLHPHRGEFQFGYSK